MPPKKINPSVSEINSQEKIVKRRVRVKKEKPNPPSIVKVSLNVSNNDTEVCETLVEPPKCEDTSLIKKVRVRKPKAAKPSRKTLKATATSATLSAKLQKRNILDYFQAKVELANEVARRQLVKTDDINETYQEPIIINIPKKRTRKSMTTNNGVKNQLRKRAMNETNIVNAKTKRVQRKKSVDKYITVQHSIVKTLPTSKRGRKKKVVPISVKNENPSETTENEEEKVTLPIDIAEIKPKIKPRRTVTRKRVADSTVENLQHISAKQPKYDNNLELDLKLDSDSLSEDIKISIDNSLATANKPSTSNYSTKPTAVGTRRLLRGKQTPANDVVTSPSILETFVKPADTETPPTNVSSTQAQLRPAKSQISPIIKTSLRRMRTKLEVNQTAESIISPAQVNRIGSPESLKSPIMKPVSLRGRKPKTAVNRIASTESRKSSMSSHSNLSWTKDISSSSTTTCITVSSSDFVRFNKRLPILKLTNIESKYKKMKEDLKQNINTQIIDKIDDKVPESDSDDSSSSSSDSSSSNTTSEKSSVVINTSLEANSINLSVTSPSNSHISRVINSKHIDENKDSDKLNYEKASEKLTSTMEKLDMTIINNVNRISTDNNDAIFNDLTKFKYKMLDILNSEFGIITHCKQLKEILNPRSVEETNEIIDTPEKKNDEVNNDNIVVENSLTKEVATSNEPTVNEEVEFVKPVPRPCASNDTEVSNVNVSNNRRDSMNQDDLRFDLDEPYNNNTDTHDDDDALSLFAESITGIECSRYSASIVSNRAEPTHTRVDEYIPRPLKQDNASPDRYIYNPSKISEGINTQRSQKSVMAIVCEKQNADSTSIYKESNSTGGDSENYQDLQERPDYDPIPMTSRFDAPENTIKLMAYMYPMRKKEKSNLFSGYCFFNLIDKCMRSRPDQKCWYSHVKPPVLLIKNKLSRLTTEIFVKEYMLLRNWPQLRRRYGICFVEECAKRGLIRILVEMALDFVLKASKNSEDAVLRANVVEITLLHLNEEPNLIEVEDLLKIKVYQELMLCDVFIAIMSVTQNFSRFKSVFLHLTYFMVENDRTFSATVAEHMLERICILPFEESVARALIQIMRLTNPSIFQNAMIAHFEKQISTHKDVYEEYMMLKNGSEFKSFLTSSVVAEVSEQAPGGKQEVREGVPLAPSPDTTNLDNMNKLAEEITKLVDTPKSANISRNMGTINQPQAQTYHHYHPGPSKDKTGNNKTQYRNWNNRSIFDSVRLRNMSSRPLMGPPITRPPPMARPPQQPFIQRVVTFRGSPTNFSPRHPSPDQ